MITRDSRQAAARSTSLRGASGIRSSPSDIRLNSSPSGCATSTARWPRWRRPSTVYITWLWPPAPAARGVDVQGEHESTQADRQAPRAACGVDRALQLPQLRELQEHRVGVDHREREARPSRRGSRAAGCSCAGTPPAPCTTRSKRRRAASALVHLPRGERRVVVDAVQVIAQIAVGVVLQLLRQLPDRPVDGHRLVHVLALPARGAAVVEPGLEVGIEVGGADPAPEVKRDARHPVGAPSAGRAASSAWISSASAGVTRSSASSEKIQSLRRQAGGEVLLIDPAGPVARSRRARPWPRAMATVSSVLPQSTTTISSAQTALSMAAPMWSASFMVMMVTVTGGTGGILPSGFGLRLRARGLRLLGLTRPGARSLQPEPLAASAARPLAGSPAPSRSRRPTGCSRGWRAARCCGPRARSRCAWNTTKLVDVPAASLRCSASSRRSASDRDDARASPRASGSVCTCRAASRTCVDDLQLLVLQLRLRLAVLQARAGQAGLGLAGAERIADVERRRPGRKVVGEQVAEHRAEAALRLADDVAGARAEGADAALQLRAAEARQAVVEAGGDLGQRLVAQEADVDVVRPRAIFVDCCRSVRLSSALRTAASTSTVIAWNGGRSDGLDVHRPEVRRRRVEDQRAQRVLRRLDLRLGDDHRLFALGHFGFGFDDVDRRRGADLDARRACCAATPAPARATAAARAATRCA